MSCHANHILHAAGIHIRRKKGTETISILSETASPDFLDQSWGGEHTCAQKSRLKMVRLQTGKSSKESSNLSVADVEVGVLRLVRTVTKCRKPRLPVLGRSFSLPQQFSKRSSTWSSLLTNPEQPPPASCNQTATVLNAVRQQSIHSHILFSSWSSSRLQSNSTAALLVRFRKYRESSSLKCV